MRTKDLHTHASVSRLSKFPGPLRIIDVVNAAAGLCPNERRGDFVVDIHAVQRGPVGRPRNVEADGKILKAALALYGDAGWHGFNMTKVAKAAGVGKSSMYTRWANVEELFLEAFRTVVAAPGPVGDSAQEVLSNEAEYRMRLYLGEHAQAVRRLFVEMACEVNPVVRAAYLHTYRDPIAAIRTRLWEFKSAGLLPEGTSVTRLLDAIEGSVLMRAFSLMPENIDCFLGEIPEYVENLVNDQLDALPLQTLRSVS